MTTRDDIALSTGIRTLSLASPLAFVDSALVPGAPGAVNAVLREPTGCRLTHSSFWATDVEIFG